MILNDEGCMRMIVSCYKNAISDFKCAIWRTEVIKRDPNWKENERKSNTVYKLQVRIEECERFFQTDYLGLLGDTDKGRIIEELREQALNGNTRVRLGVKERTEV